MKKLLSILLLFSVCLMFIPSTAADVSANSPPYELVIDQTSIQNDVILTKSTSCILSITENSFISENHFTIDILTKYNFSQEVIYIYKWPNLDFSLYQYTAVTANLFSNLNYNSINYSYFIEPINFHLLI